MFGVTRDHASGNCEMWFQTAIFHWMIDRPKMGSVADNREVTGGVKS